MAISALSLVQYLQPPVIACSCSSLSSGSAFAFSSIVFSFMKHALIRKASSRLLFASLACFALKTDRLKNGFFLHLRSRPDLVLRVTLTTHPYFCFPSSLTSSPPLATMPLTNNQ